MNRYFEYPVDGVSADEPGPAETVEVGLLANAGEAEWSLLLDYGERRKVASGEVIIEQGTPGRSLIIVLTGTFRVTYSGRRRGRPATVATIGPGDVVGEVGFAAGGQRSNSVVADSHGEIFEFEWESFERLAAAHPTLGVRILTDVLHIVGARVRATAR